MNMHHYTFPIFSSKKLIVGFLLLLSVLLTAYSPMASYSQAQTVTNNALQELKQKATAEITRRLADYKKTMESLKVDVHLDSTGSSANATSANGSTTTTVGKDGLSTNVAIPSGIQDQVKQFMQKMVEQLTGLLGKVQSTDSLSGMKSLSENIDTQFNVDQLTNVQATVTQAIESMTGVFDKLKTTFSGLQSQVTQLKECESGAVSGSGASVACDDLNVSSGDTATQAQSSLDSLSSIMTTIASVLASAVSLLMTLVTSFSGMMGGMGSLGSLGNLGNLGSMTDLSSLTGSLGSMTGMMSSFSAITSQLDITSLMSGNAFGNLSSLTSLINI
jgi:hypothetical protein